MYKIIYFLCVFLLLLNISESKEEKLTKVRILPHWLPQAQFAGIYMAKEKGIYEKYGLDVTVLTGGPNLPVKTALDENQTDFFTTFLPSAIKLRSQDYNIVNIAQLSQKTALMYVAKASSGINNINDLNGKKIGVWMTDFQEVPLAYLNRHNVEAEIIPVKNTINLFLLDGIDVISAMWYNEYYQIYLSGYDMDKLVTFFLNVNKTNIPEDGIYTTSRFYKRNSVACKNFVKATLEGWQYAFKHKQETLEVVNRYMHEAEIPATRALQSWMLSRIEEVFIANDSGKKFGKLYKEDFEATVKLLDEIGTFADTNRQYQNIIKFEEFALELIDVSK